MLRNKFRTALMLREKSFHSSSPLLAACCLSLNKMLVLKISRIQRVCCRSKSYTSVNDKSAREIASFCVFLGDDQCDNRLSHNETNQSGGIHSMVAVLVVSSEEREKVSFYEIPVSYRTDHRFRSSHRSLCV